MSTLCYGNEFIVHYEGKEIRVWKVQESGTFREDCDRRWTCKHKISCVTVEGSEIILGTLTGSLWSLRMRAGSDIEEKEIPTQLPTEGAITHVRLLNGTTILIFKESCVHKVRRKSDQNPQKEITFTPNRDCFFLYIDSLLKDQKLDEQENLGFVFLDVSFTGRYVFLGDTKGTTLLGNLTTYDLTPIARNFLSACFLFTSSTKVTYVLSSTAASTYQINTVDVKSKKIQHIWGDKELESGCQFEEQSITAYNGKIAQVQDGRPKVQDFNHLRNIDGPLHFDRIIHFAAIADCSITNVIHGALLVENRKFQSICTWTYSNGKIKPYSLQQISHNKKYTRIARNESLLAVCSETQKKKMTSFVDVLIWRNSSTFQRIPVSSKVIDFTKHFADSFCVATETEIILVNEKNFKIKKYEEGAIAVRYNHQTKRWKRLLRTKVTYKDCNENEQVNNYVIDPYGQNWIIADTDEGVLNWYREGERKSMRLNVSETLTLLGFFEGEKIITYDESGDPMIRCYTLRVRKDDENQCEEEEEEEKEEEEEEEESDENELKNESRESESDENESDESESDESESDENESDESESDENESDESDSNENDSNENDSDENDSDENDSAENELNEWNHDWEIQQCLGLSTIHVIGDVTFLVTPEDLSVLENQEVRNLLKTDFREESEFA